jgi:hypothetical protein
MIAGRMISLSVALLGGTFTLVHGTGNIRLNGNANFTADTINDQITLVWQNGTNNWVEVGRAQVA